MPPPKQLENPPKGTRTPGSGRKPGTLNRVSVQAKVLVGELVTDVAYQSKLRRDFKARKVHPAIETLVWSYHLGKPNQPVELSGGLAIDVNARIEEERRVFAQLDIADLEQLAAESQNLVNRAYQLAKTAGTPLDIVVEAEPAKHPSETLTNVDESNNGYSVNKPTIPDADTRSPFDTED
jgi:hypothetical protein